MGLLFIPMFIAGIVMMIKNPQLLKTLSDMISKQIDINNKDNEISKNIEITHKVENGNKKYYTKGDFNHTLDEGYITYEDINSKVLFSVPFIGYPSLIINKIW